MSTAPIPPPLLQSALARKHSLTQQLHSVLEQLDRISQGLQLLEPWLTKEEFDRVHSVREEYFEAHGDLIQHIAQQENVIENFCSDHHWHIVPITSSVLPYQCQVCGKLLSSSEAGRSADNCQ